MPVRLRKALFIALLVIGATAAQAQQQDAHSLTCEAAIERIEEWRRFLVGRKLQVRYTGRIKKVGFEQEYAPQVEQMLFYPDRVLRRDIYTNALGEVDETAMGAIGKVLLYHNVESPFPDGSLESNVKLWDDSWKRVLSGSQSRFFLGYALPLAGDLIERLRQVPAWRETSVNSDGTVFEGNVNGLRCELTLGTGHPHPLGIAEVEVESDYRQNGKDYQAITTIHYIGRVRVGDVSLPERIQINISDRAVDHDELELVVQLKSLTLEQKPFERWSDVLEDVPDGMPVIVDGNRPSPFSWCGGEMVRTSDGKPLAEVFFPRH